MDPHAFHASSDDCLVSWKMQLEQVQLQVHTIDDRTSLHGSVKRVFNVFEHDMVTDLLA